MQSRMLLKVSLGQVSFLRPLAAHRASHLGERFHPACIAGLVRARRGPGVLHGRLLAHRAGLVHGHGPDRLCCAWQQLFPPSRQHRSTCAWLCSMRPAMTQRGCAQSVQLCSVRAVWRSHSTVAARVLHPFGCLSMHACTRCMEHRCCHPASLCSSVAGSWSVGILPGRRMLADHVLLFACL